MGRSPHHYVGLILTPNWEQNRTTFDSRREVGYGAGTVAVAVLKTQHPDDPCPGADELVVGVVIVLLVVATTARRIIIPR